MRRRRLPAGAQAGSLTAVSLRSLRARPLRSLLSTGAIVLGVGMVCGVLLLVGTIRSSFDRLYDSVYGRTDLVVSGTMSVGSLPERAIGRVRAVEGVETASGSIYSLFRLLDDQGRVRTGQSDRLSVQGVDYAQPDLSTAQRTDGRKPRVGNEIELQGDWAKDAGIDLGDTIGVATPTGTARLRVVGLFEFEGGLDLGGYGAGSMPVSAARQIMDKAGVWDEISVVTADGASTAAVKRRLEAALGRGVEVATPQAKGQETQDQLAGLNVVLYFMSGIALFVGAFLILNSFNMTVLQRVREIGTLRALGASRPRVARSVLAEAAILGAAGSVLGLGLGAGLAVLLVRGMRSFGLPVSAVQFSAGALAAAVLTGVAATLAGAAWPAVRAARIPPVRALTGGREARTRPGLRRAVLGVLLFLPGLVLGGLFWFGNRSGALAAIGGAGTTMVMFVGIVLLAPYVVLPLARLAAVPLRAAMPAEGRLASDAAQANPRRTAATAAALVVALSVVVVNATVASSFVGSVSDELDRRLARDVTVQPVGFNEFGGPQTPISPALARRIERLPEAGAVSRRRSVFVTSLPNGGQAGLVIGVDPGPWLRVDRMTFAGASSAEARRGLAAGGAAPAEAYAKARGLAVGDRLTLAGPAGRRTVPVVAIADTLDAGGQALFVSLGTMARVYGVTNDSQLAVVAASPGRREALARGIEALVARDYPGLEAVSTADVKADQERAIGQQFAFFNAIVAIAVLVGALGIVNTLSMSVIERTREIGVLRALGASRWRVRRTIADESLLISLAATFAGIGVGLLVAVTWLVAMREATFPGLSLKLPVGLLAMIAVLGVVVGVAAAILPARRAARLDPLAALQYE